MSAKTFAALFICSLFIAGCTAGKLEAYGDLDDESLGIEVADDGSTTANVALAGLVPIPAPAPSPARSSSGYGGRKLAETLDVSNPLASSDALKLPENVAHRHH